MEDLDGNAYPMKVFGIDLPSEGFITGTEQVTSLPGKYSKRDPEMLAEYQYLTFFTVLSQLLLTAV
ncbi:hypothetical protein [Arthrobacter sp. S39]|uniref:hypothetical protein n=1 Tax=Arthrobacter sp. S39 TaxID=2509720 RepID=UPI00103735AA|nr:hypothetical protein [Arthrobacter sp. S39]TAP44616.1 hypothetical protein EYS21_08970 [Arthrobacter sp. S39]